jgi:ABC-type Fe3+/spermidine/putrescine transport system ATPase subunit
MLLDEPFSVLDTGLRGAMRKMVARLLTDAGVTTILVTHDQSEALSFADQLAVMRDGRLVQSGHPLDLYHYPDDEQTALFLGDAVVMPARIEAGLGPLRSRPYSGEQPPEQQIGADHAAARTTATRQHPAQPNEGCRVPRRNDRAGAAIPAR